MPFDGPIIAAAFQNLINKFKKEAPASKEKTPTLYDALDAKFKVGQEFDYLGFKCRVTFENIDGEVIQVKRDLIFGVKVGDSVMGDVMHVVKRIISVEVTE